MRRRSPLLLSAALAMAVSLMPGLAPLVARAADTPDGAVNAVLDAIVSKQWDAIGPLVCEAKRDEVASQFDLSEAFSGDGIDAAPLVAAMTLTIDDRAVTVLSEVDDAASVRIEGLLRISVDETAARDWVRQTLEVSGQPTDDASIDQFMGFFLSSMEEGTDLASTVDVTRENGDWLMCDDLEEDTPDESFDPGASLPPAVGALCEHLTVEELNAATGLAFVSTTPFDGGCSWDSDLSAEYYNVSLYQEEGELSFIKEVWTDGQDLTIGGRPAWGTVNGTWVDLGDGLLTIMPYLEGAPSTESLDVIAFSQAVGDIVVPRIP